MSSLRVLVAAQPEEHLFVVVSGSHLYGYPSPDSDIDLRGCHLVPTDRLFALARPAETVERLEPIEGSMGGGALPSPHTPQPIKWEVETVSHEVEKALRLLLKRNGALIEQIYSPLVVVETPALAELRELARGCVTRGLYHHYRASMYGVRQQYQRQARRQAKYLLALYRLAMTAIHVLRHGEIEANLPRLNEQLQLPGVQELMAVKAGAEAATVAVDEPYLRDIDALGQMLDEAYAESRLPEAPVDRARFDAFLYQQRWAGLR